MSASYKPAGYTSLAPYLVVSGATGVIQFVTDVFAASELRRFTDPAGRIAHAEVRIDDTVVMLAEASDACPPVPAHVHVFVADVDAVFARAIELGAAVIQPPKQAEDNDKRCGFKDAGGTTWWVSTKVG